MAQKLLPMAAVTWSTSALLVPATLELNEWQQCWEILSLKKKKKKTKKVKNSIDTDTKEGKGAIFVEEWAH